MSDPFSDRIARVRERGASATEPAPPSGGAFAARIAKFRTVEEPVIPPRAQRPQHQYPQIEERRAARDAARKEQYAGVATAEPTQLQREERMRQSPNFADRYLQRNMEQLRDIAGGVGESIGKVFTPVPEEQGKAALTLIGRGIAAPFTAAASPITAYAREYTASSPEYAEASPMGKAGIVAARSISGMEDIPAEGIMEAGEMVGMDESQTEAAAGALALAVPWLTRRARALSASIAERRMAPGAYDRAMAPVRGAAEQLHPLAQQEISSAIREGTGVDAWRARQAITQAELARGSVAPPSGPPSPYDAPERPPYMGIETGGKARLVARGKGQPQAPEPLPGMGGDRLPDGTPPYMGVDKTQGARGPEAGSTQPLREGAPGLAAPVPIPRTPHQVEGGPTRPTTATGPGVSGAAEAGMPGVAPPSPATPPPAHPLMGGGVEPRTRFGRRSERGSVGPGGGGPMPLVGEALESARKSWEESVGKLAAKATDNTVGEFLKQRFIHEPELVSSKYAERVYERRGGQALGQARGLYDAQQVEKALKGADDATVQGVFDYMDSTTDTLPASLSKEQKAGIDATVQRIRQSSDALLERGLLSPEAHAEYPRYLRRIYEAHRGRTQGQVWAKGSRPRLPETIARMDAYNIEVRIPEAQAKALAGSLDAQYVHQQGNSTLLKFRTPEARKAFMDRLRQEQLASKTVKGSVTDPIPKEMREALGEVRDLGQVVAETVSYNQSKVANYDFLASLVDDGDTKGAWTRNPEEGQRPPKNGDTQKIDGIDYEFISGRSYGPLSDKWVRSDVAADVKGSFGVSEPGDWANIKRAWKAGLAEWKANRTTLNPSTQALNILSMPVMFEQAGVSLFDPRNWKYIKEAAQRLAKNDPYAADLARRIGSEVVGVDYVTKEIGKQKRGLPEAIGRVIGSGGVSMLDKVPGFKKVRSGANRAYAFYDNLVRDAAYTKRIAEGMSHAEAVQHVNLYTPNYGRVGSWVRGLRQSPVGSPFLSFAYEQKRILANNLRHHPVRAARTLMMTYTAGKALQAALGSDATPEELEALRQSGDAFGMGGGWLGFSNRIPVGRDDKGNLRFLDIGQMDPNQELLAGPSQAMDSSVLGMDPELSNGILYAARLMGIQANPAYDALVTLARGRTRYGKELRTTGDYMQFAGSQLAHPLTPGLGSKAIRIERGFDPSKRTKFSDIQTAQDAMLDAILHVQLGLYTPEQANEILRIEYGRAKGKIKSEARQAGQDNPEDRPEINQEKTRKLVKLRAKRDAERERRVAYPPR